MTERKPADVNFETWVDKQIREAADRGEFDDLPGLGKPLPGLNKPHDDLWWIKQKVDREGFSTEALLPEPLQLRKEIQRLPDTVRNLLTEHAVRDTVEQLNLRIVDWLRAPSGPRVPISPVNTDDVVEQWHADRRAADLNSAQATENSTPPRRAPWWRRFTRRDRKSS